MKKINKLKHTKNNINTKTYNFYGDKRNRLKYYLKNKSHRILIDILIISIPLAIIHLIAKEKPQNPIKVLLPIIIGFTIFAIILDLWRTPKYENIYGFTDESITIIKPIDNIYGFTPTNYKIEKSFPKKEIDTITTIDGNSRIMTSQGVIINLPQTIVEKELTQNKTHQKNPP